MMESDFADFAKKIGRYRDKFVTVVAIAAFGARADGLRFGSNYSEWSLI